MRGGGKWQELNKLKRKELNRSTNLPRGEEECPADEMVHAGRQIPGAAQLCLLERRSSGCCALVAAGLPSNCLLEMEEMQQEGSKVAPRGCFFSSMLSSNLGPSSRQDASGGHAEVARSIRSGRHSCDR